VLLPQNITSSSNDINKFTLFELEFDETNNYDTITASGRSLE
jgi:hypothetical protein